MCASCSTSQSWSAAPRRFRCVIESRIRRALFRADFCAKNRAGLCSLGASIPPAENLTVRDRIAEGVGVVPACGLPRPRLDIQEPQGSNARRRRRTWRPRGSTRQRPGRWSRGGRPRDAKVRGSRRRTATRRGRLGGKVRLLRQQRYNRSAQGLTRGGR